MSRALYAVSCVVPTWAACEEFKHLLTRLEPHRATHFTRSAGYLDQRCVARNEAPASLIDHLRDI